MARRLRHALLWLLTSWRRAAVALAGLAVLVLGGVVLFAWLGIYNIAASAGHLAIVDHFLRFGMINSVRTHAPDSPFPPLDDPALIALGAAHFEAGCTFCHGAPGRPVSPAAGAALPPPPDLADNVDHWNDGELFWIVRHGVKYTGMPAWPVAGRDDEVWAVVAFLRRLPGLGAEGYRRLAGGEVQPDDASAAEIAQGQAPPDLARACARCHGGKGPPASELVPRLHGQPEQRLLGAMHDYAAGRRRSGIMQLAVNDLDEPAMGRLARYYASLPPLPPASASPPAGVIAHGEALARQGDVARDIPPCLSCHRPGSRPDYPRLAGQPERYLAGQLRILRHGLNGASPTGAIMTPVAKRLDDKDIAAVSAYFSSRPPEPEAAR
ncbi:c-type cytochrome [Bosea thiooxidans]